MAEHIYSRTDKSAAKKLGISVEEWHNKRKSGLNWCYCCKKWKPKEHFGIDNSRKSKITPACKPCISLKATASRYKISISKTLELRSGKLRCEICDRKQKLEVDHCHKSGKVRGLICGRCNRALGSFKDSYELVKKGLEYLEKWEKEQK
jgi:hypothetical protein